MPRQYTPAFPAATRVCEHCGDSFKVWASALKRGGNRGRFCSQSCRSAGWITPQQRMCEVCGSPFTAEGTAIRRGDAKFCSVACRDTAARRRIIVQCPTCGDAFETVVHRVETRRKVYCSKPCADNGLSVPLADRFWTHVAKTPGCWLWNGHINRTGYAQTRRGGSNGGNIGVHVAAWEMASGELVSAGMHVAHTCDVRHCVRNDQRGTYEVDGVVYERFGHLFVCPQPVNERDKVAKGRQARGARNGRVLHPDSYPTGSEWPMAKLSEDDVRTIRAAYAAKQATQMELAHRYHVRQATISSIVLGKTWRHIA